MRLKPVVALLALLVFASPGFGLSLDSLDATFGILFIGNTDPAAGGPSPIVQLYGASMPLRIAGPFFLEPMLEFFGTYYEWSGTRAVPTAYEAGPSFFTLGTLVSLHSGVSFPVSSAVSLGGSIGLDFLLRFPLEFTNTLPESIAGREPSLGYFFGMGRFFYPETRLFLRWQVSDSMGLVVNLRAFYPLFHLWDGEGLPFLDQFMFSGGIGFAFRLGPAPAPAAPAASAGTNPPSAAP